MLIQCRVILAEGGTRSVGFAAIRPGILDHLYVSPDAQGGGASVAA